MSNQSLGEVADLLDQANANLEAAKAAEAQAVSARKKAALEQREAQEAFNDAVSARKKKRASPKAKAETKAPKAPKPKKADKQ